MRLLAPVFLALLVSAAAGDAVAADPGRGAGDAVRGQAQFKRCETCHSLKSGMAKPGGPNLSGVLGRQAAGDAKFEARYSFGLKAARRKGLTWDEDSLFAYLDNPAKFLRTYLARKRVSNRKVNRYRNAAMRRNIIAYLKTAN